LEVSNLEIIGRKRERQQLLDYYHSKKSEFVVVYGRRRVGKTFLVRETFNNEFFFYFTGHVGTEDNPVTIRQHLAHFADALTEQGLKVGTPPTDWDSAFNCLKDAIKAAGSKKRKVVFIDEMPWLDLPKSGFVSALEYFWNSFASARSDLLFIVCGSAAAWISTKLFKNRGGLHNRITGKINLKPFTLVECEDFLNAKGAIYPRYDIVECFMVFGGIPYYLDYINPKYSVAVNVDNIVFAEGSPLEDEFAQLFASLFKHPQRYVDVVTALSTKKRGLTRDEIISLIKRSNGGNISEILKTLEQSGFIRHYYAYPNNIKRSMYQLIDNFSLFWFSFAYKTRSTSPHYWSQIRSTPKLNNWRGYAFEMVCLQHINQIEQELGIFGILTQVSSWKSKESEEGAQIDLIIERDDRVINLCEIKYSQSEFEITKAQAQKLRNRLATFKSETRTNRTLFLTMISTYGIKRGKHSELVHNEVTMEALFLPSR
jgi:AAA+ ATPase superfamily predicted ATPase